MTRERAKELAPIIAAYADGKAIQWRNTENDPWEDGEQWGFRDGYQYRIKPEPAKRLMTRNEVLGFVAHNPHIVVRNNSREWASAHGWGYLCDIETYEWATITERGEIGDPHKFEVEDD